MDVQRPIITEKSLGLASRGWYTFAVTKHARKESIAKDVAAMYHVDVTTIRTVAMHGKVRRSGKKMVPSYRGDWKKAIVQLKAGQKIDAFEVTQEKASAQEMPEAQKVNETKESTKVDEKALQGKEAPALKGKKK